MHIWVSFRYGSFELWEHLSVESKPEGLPDDCNWTIISLKVPAAHVLPPSIADDLSVQIVVKNSRWIDAVGFNHLEWLGNEGCHCSGHSSRQ